MQRPENVLAGYIRWTDYRSADWPNAIKIEHHKTGAIVWHPLEEMTDIGPVKFYEEAEEILAQLPRFGIPMILREVRKGLTKPYSFSGMQKIVQDLPLYACRHGGMTELEEAELVEREGRRADQFVRASLCRICQANDGTRSISYPKAPHASPRERRGNRISK